MPSVILLFIINIIALGLGPQGVGILSDLLAPRFEGEALPYALLVVVVGFAAWSVLRYALAARTIRDDMTQYDTRSVDGALIAPRAMTAAKPRS
jgi:hypothetical protein